ncbi:hypothetical protein, partial [Chryseobacterium sp. OSA05B]
IEPSPEEAAISIQNFYAKSAGSSPENGWELLSEKMKGVFDYTTFESIWQEADYAEIVAIQEASRHEYNTYNVNVLIYDFDDDSRLNRSFPHGATLHDYQSTVRLAKSGRLWLVDDLVSNIARGKMDEHVYFATAIVTEDTKTLEFPWDKAMPITTVSAGKYLEVYCAYGGEFGSDPNTEEWLRTNLGWISSSQVSLQNKPRG